MPGEIALRHGASADPDALALVVCGLSRRERAYVSDGFRRRAITQAFDTYGELDAALPSLDRCDAFVLAIRDATGRSALETARRLEREWQHTAVVVFCPPRPEGQSGIAALAAAGVRRFVFEGVNDTSASLAEAVDSARREAVATTVYERLSRLVPVTLQPLVEQVLSRPTELTTVEAVAARLGVHRKTLVNRCAKAGFPAPGELITWCRLSLVAEMLERTGMTIEAIALLLGFPSHNALRNQMKRYTGMKGTDIREHGGLSALLASMEARLERPNRELPIQ